jgi:hypothetical protein
MKRFSEQLHTKSQSIKLSSAEKAQLQERLVSYMEYHPLPAHLKTTNKSKSLVTNDSFTTINIPLGWLFKSSAVAAAFVLLIVPFMAERSVPGDSLYAVKVQFNEEVRSTLTFDTVQKVEWETERVNRRIAEARLLKSEGRLTEKVEAQVAQAVLTHTQNAQREIALLRETDADEATIASIAFYSTLEAQATSLQEEPSEAKETDEFNSASTSTTVKKDQNLIANAVAESRAFNEKPDASTTPSYEKLMARVEIGTTRMYELRGSIADKDSQAYVGITRRIEDIERSILLAIEKSTDSKSDSQQILIDVLQRSQKMIVFMTDLQVSQTVNIDELVPVVLTSEEATASREAYNAELDAKLEQIQVNLEQSVTLSLDVREKVAKGLADIAVLRETMLTTSEFLAYKALVTEAIEIATDSLKVIEVKGIANTVNLVPEDASSTTASTSKSTTATSTATTTTATSSIDA